MKKLLLVSCMMLLGSNAWADNIDLSVFQDGTLVGTASSANGELDINSQSYGTFDINSLSIKSASFLAPPAILNTNTLNVQQGAQSAAHTLEIDITASGLSGPNALTNLLSEFSVTGLTPGWSAQEFTTINGAPLSNTPIFTANSASADVNSAAFLGGTFAADVHYIVNSDVSLTGGQFNGGIDINTVPVPAPILGAGLPGILGLFGAGWLFARRRDGASVAV